MHFRCNYRRIVEYPNLWAYTRELYQWPGVAQTVAMEQIKRHYYTTHDELNPKHIIPVGPAPDWDEPHGRDDVGPHPVDVPSSWGWQAFATLASVVATGALGGANHRGATSIIAARLGILRSSTSREEAQ